MNRSRTLIVELDRKGTQHLSGHQCLACGFVILTSLERDASFSVLLGEVPELDDVGEDKCGEAGSPRGDWHAEVHRIVHLGEQNFTVVSSMMRKENMAFGGLAQKENPPQVPISFGNGDTGRTLTYTWLNLDDHQMNIVPPDPEVQRSPSQNFGTLFLFGRGHKGLLYWDDFAKAMTNVGYWYGPRKGGSRVEFVRMTEHGPCTFKWHRPYGQRKGKACLDHQGKKNLANALKKAY
ncbi:hypothetical protein BV20DRAFT_977505 [Pilatotrama ljubarskyi]|nr:hypothetical protein BV20DRAFT_977505 [Pilatotrama ljubarskyi]